MNTFAHVPAKHSPVPVSLPEFTRAIQFAAVPAPQFSGYSMKILQFLLHQTLRWGLHHRCLIILQRIWYYSGAVLLGNTIAKEPAVVCATFSIACQDSPTTQLTADADTSSNDLPIYSNHQFLLQWSLQLMTILLIIILLMDEGLLDISKIPKF